MTRGHNAVMELGLGEEDCNEEFSISQELDGLTKMHN